MAGRRQGRGGATVLLVALAGAAPAGRSTAQEADPPAPSSRACAGATAVYSSPNGLRLVATRHGSVSPDNPLRPLSGNRLEVLQVVVNGRVATAFGPDPENMRQGPDPKRLEAALGAPISWSAESEDYPLLIRVVAEDGRVLIDALRFQECATVQASAAGPARAGRTRSGRGAAADALPEAPRAGADATPMPMQMPRGSLE